MEWSGQRVSNNDVLQKFNLEDIGKCIKRRRLRWFGHVERKTDDDWVKKCMSIEVDGKRGKGRPMKTWSSVVKHDMKVMGLKREDAQDRCRWMGGIYGKKMNDGKF